MLRLAAILLLIDLSLLGSAVWLAFGQSPPDDSATQREAAAYQKYAQQFGPSQIGPAECRSDADLAALATALDSPLKPPAEYAAAWKETGAVQLFEKWRTDLKLYCAIQKTLADDFDARMLRGTELLFPKQRDEAWEKAVIELLSHSIPLGNVPDSLRIPGRRGAPLTYEIILESDRVELSNRHWQATRRQLTGEAALHAIIPMILPPARAVIAFAGR